ncbi:MAG: AI-2E family transporter [Pseudomonadota bacterium]
MSERDHTSETAEAHVESASRRLDLRDVFYVLGLITLVVAVLVLAADVLAPIVLAVLIWFLVNAIAQGLRSVAPSLPQSAALTFGAVTTLGVMYLCGSLIVSNLSELSDGFDQLGPRADAAVRAVEAQIGFDLDLEVSAILQNLQIQDFLGQIVSALTSTASTTLLVLLYVLFLLFDQPHYQAKIRALFPDEARYNRVGAVLAKIGEDARIYIWIMTTVSIGVGLLTYFIASYFGLKGAAFWGFLAFALNYIPTIGSFLGVLFPAAFALVQFDHLEDVGLLVIGLGVVQFVAGNLILPRVTGDRLNLSEFVVILSLTVWGAMWGVAGMFLAVPMMMVLAIVLSQFDSTRPLAILLSKTGKVARAED